MPPRRATTQAGPKRMELIDPLMDGKRKTSPAAAKALRPAKRPKTAAESEELSVAASHSNLGDEQGDCRRPYKSFIDKDFPPLQDVQQSRACPPNLTHEEYEEYKEEMEWWLQPWEDKQTVFDWMLSNIR